MQIRFTVETKSNLLIGGNESGFEIGGIDMHTVVDHDGYPYIPGSSFKGAFRKIIRDDNNKSINTIFAAYKRKIFERATTKAQELDFKIDIEDFKKNIEKGVEVDSEYMFGINSYNQSPKLMFSDLYLVEESESKEKDFFSIDNKNTIGNDLIANPRTYKSLRKGLKFMGIIRFRNFNELGLEAHAVIEYVKQKLPEFNNGVYRLGNSKSRGYGHIEVKVCEEND